MPLVVLCGIPNSGKSYHAKKLKDFFSSHPATSSLPIYIVSDPTLHIEKSAYDDSNQEKKARGLFMSTIERYLKKDTIVIADGYNYIKGFRYQLYCVARAVQSTYCVVSCEIPKELSHERNRTLPEAYSQATLDSLISRFEAPHDKHRWDSPLFVVTHLDSDLPYPSIVEALINKKAPKPNLATAVKPVSETNYLAELEKTTQQIIQSILEAQKSDPYQEIRFPNATHTLSLDGRIVSLAELRRIKRQFMSVTKIHTILDMGRSANSFIDFIQVHIRE